MVTVILQTGVPLPLGVLIVVTLVVAASSQPRIRLPFAGRLARAAAHRRGRWCRAQARGRRHFCDTCPEVARHHPNTRPSQLPRRAPTARGLGRFAVVTVLPPTVTTAQHRAGSVPGAGSPEAFADCAAAIRAAWAEGAPSASAGAALTDGGAGGGLAAVPFSTASSQAAGAEAGPSAPTQLPRLLVWVGERSPVLARSGCPAGAAGAARAVVVAAPASHAERAA